MPQILYIRGYNSFMELHTFSDEIEAYSLLLIFLTWPFGELYIWCYGSFRKIVIYSQNLRMHTIKTPDSDSDFDADPESRATWPISGYLWPELSVKITQMGQPVADSQLQSHF